MKIETISICDVDETQFVKSFCSIEQIALKLNGISFI